MTRRPSARPGAGRRRPAATSWPLRPSPSMNFIKGRIDAADGRRVFVSESGARLPVGEAKAENGQPVIYGIRPEHIDIGPGGIPVRVSVLEPTGSETQVFARIGDDAIDAVVRDRIQVRPGEQVLFRIDPRRTHVFDRTSTARL